ncbi:hypothetical protein BKA63DRAFT_492702 [Paraphoma chrysanthemicola]|nr:hypothetical protein BKA63DRAFT_492702 [Paraphoma chrysanthemicola]
MSRDAESNTFGEAYVDMLYKICLNSLAGQRCRQQGVLKKAMPTLTRTTAMRSCKSLRKDTARENKSCTYAQDELDARLDGLQRQLRQKKDALEADYEIERAAYAKKEKRLAIQSPATSPTTL